MTTPMPASRIGSALGFVVRLAMHAPRRVLGWSAAAVLVALLFGLPVTEALSTGGFEDPGSESSAARRILAETFNRGDMQLLVTVSSPDGAMRGAARAVGSDIVERIGRSQHVTQVTSPWNTPPQAAAALVGENGRTGLVIANIEGGQNAAPKYAQALVDEYVHSRDGVDVRAGGNAVMYAQIKAQTQRDLRVMESIAIPVSFLALVWVFGGVVAAAIPVAVGLIAIVGSMATLRLLTFWTDVSVFALNLTIAMGFALAIDYTLLILSRYREEIGDGRSEADALRNTIATAGRTVVFSAITVGLSMTVMMLFPMYFLRSFAYAGVAVVLFAAVATLLVAPAAIGLLGGRLRIAGGRRSNGRRSGKASVGEGFWRKISKTVMKRAVIVSLVGTTLLGLAGVPFLHIAWGFPDERVLPTSTSARQVGDQLRQEFAADPAGATIVVVPDTSGVPPGELGEFAARLSLAPDVSSVSAPGGTYVNGVLVGPRVAAAEIADDSAFLTIESTAPLFSARSKVQLEQLHNVSGPAGESFMLTGTAQMNRDGVRSVTTIAPAALGIIGAIAVVLLFLLTGSAVLPLKAILLDVLSLTAVFGALVWVFQEGHLGGLGTTATRTIDVTMPMLMFCIVFGLSMDYEVFLISRIREYWLSSGGTAGANDASITEGLARTGRVITAAALLMCVSFAALTVSQVSFMRMFGFGLALAVLVDATLVRMIMVPALMHLMGRFNWWAPPALARLHRRFGIAEAEPSPSGDPDPEPTIPVGEGLERETPGVGR